MRVECEGIGRNAAAGGSRRFIPLMVPSRPSAVAEEAVGKVSISLRTAAAAAVRGRLPGICIIPHQMQTIGRPNETKVRSFYR